MDTLLQRLQSILSETDSTARVQTERIAPSFYYDPTYSFAVMACAMRIAGKTNKKEAGQSKTIINATQLRFYTFCAIRPYLLKSLKRWKERSANPSLLELTDLRLLPHGFLLDSSLSDALLFLISTGNLEREGAGGSSVALANGNSALLLNRLYDLVISNDFMKSERCAIEELHSLRVTLTDLGLG